jgi:hypothetical protein
MNYSKHFFALLTLVALLFAGCQKSGDINSPVDDQLGKGANWETGYNGLTFGNLPQTVDLVAGQFYKVGSVSVSKDMSGNLVVSYNLSAGLNGYITEVHVDLASAQVSNPPTGFNVNSSKSPVFGNFDSKNYAKVFSNSDKTVSVTFPAADLPGLLGVASINASTKFFIAAHAGVCYESAGGSVVTGTGLCPEWTGGVWPLTALSKRCKLYINCWTLSCIYQLRHG